MKITALTVLAAFAALSSSSSCVSADSGAGSSRGQLKHRGGLVRRIRGAVVGENGQEAHYVNLQKRFSGRATFYNNEVSEGACGGYSSSDDNIVALNVAQYGNPDAVSSWCGKKIQISYGGVTQTATVVDCCPTCPFGGLDMSKGLFEGFTGLDAGVFQMSWSAAGAEAPKPKPKTTHTTSHSSTRTTSTHTHTPRPTTTSTSTSSTSSSSSTTSSSSSSSETPSATPTPVQNLDSLREVMQGMLNLANNAAAA